MEAMQVKWMIAIIFMIIFTVYDIKTKEVPIFWLLLFAGAAVAYNCMRGSGKEEWMGIVYALVPGASLLALSLCTRESIGYGDGWTVLALGMLLGLWDCLAVVFAGLIFSAVFSLILLVLHRVGKKSRLPFLPFITMGLGVTIAAQNIF